MRSEPERGAVTVRSRGSTRSLAVQGVVLTVLATLLSACGTPDTQDEAMSGRTLRGTPVAKRGPECFPAEPRDLFWEMDQVAGPNGLQPLDFDENGDKRVDDVDEDAHGLTERDAIRGRNTWLVWGGGNETFWGWLQEQGYATTDLMVLLDSRERGNRFKWAGLINQPGLERSTQPFLGLYLDQAKSNGSAVLRPPQGPRGPYHPAPYVPAPEDHDPYGTAPEDSDPYDRHQGEKQRPYYDEAEAERYDAQDRRLPTEVRRPPGCDGEPFTPWTTLAKRKLEWTSGDRDPLHEYIPAIATNRLPRDGLDPSVYGYPSGVFGLRLWLNPDFFADTEDAERARFYWQERVEKTGGRYYTDRTISADPDLVRPFRVSMSCGFCHIGPHPLNPPDDPEAPKWANLSGIIGGQYWDAQPSLGTLLTRNDFLYHFLKSQAPGTVDTSLISTDHINNTNVINAVFDVPARLDRALAKPTEEQSEANLLLPGFEDLGNTTNRRHFPMVLFPGEDSIGVFGALARVYLNIGVFGEQWNRVDNPIIGFTPQRPFSIETNRKNSVFWQVNENYGEPGRAGRVGYLAKFFLLGSSKQVPKSTAPMLLKDAGKDGIDNLKGEKPEEEEAKRVRGRAVFVDHCAICHSSKQPDGFDLVFEREVPGGWTQAPVPPDAQRPVYTLPIDYAHWEDFKHSPGYRDYRERIRWLAGPAPSKDPEKPNEVVPVDRFIEDNFLSNELRIPVTLVGTYSGRAMATNAMRGQVWDNFSSETFKKLPSVGEIGFYNPYEAGLPIPDPLYGTNDSYSDGRESGGPGYFRPASLISLWATAPYFHNNALGIYNQQPSVSGRLDAFEDGIQKLLWSEQRRPGPRISKLPPELPLDPKLHPGDLRLDAGPAGKGDPGYIYRVPVDTELAFAAKFIRPLLEGVLSGYLGLVGGRIAFSVLSLWLWVVLVAGLVLGARRGRGRHLGALLLLVAVAFAVLLAVSGAGGWGGTMLGTIVMLGMGLMTLLSVPAWWLWLGVVALGLLGSWLLLTGRERRRLTSWVFAGLALLSLGAGLWANAYLNGHLAGIRLGPIPRGTPVNLLMNIDPEKTDKLPAAIVALARGIIEVRKQGLTGDAAHAVFEKIAARSLLEASKVPDFVLDRGHWFGEKLSEGQKLELIAFLKTL